jgi:hypothetical protein|tara:strand:+ start:1791 stop:4289 length:2499 start_codon:yes stop_codon:yes gene_type:complete
MKDFKIIELMELFDEGEVIPASQMQRPQSALDREMFEDANERLMKAGGGRIAFKDGPKKILTGEKFIEIAEKFPDKSNKELLEYFNKNNFVNRTGDALSLGAIKTQKSKFFNVSREIKDKIPTGYIKSTDVFENLPISKKDYFRVKQAKKGGTLLTQEIDNLLKPVKIGETFYFKKPNKTDLKSFIRLADKTGRLNNRIADLMIEFDKVYGKNFEKGIIPNIEDVKQKFNITDSTAGKVTTRLAQWYSGQDFKNTQLKNLKRNKVTSNKMFQTIEKSPFGNPYRQGLYEISLQTIDSKLGDKQGTFAKFKTQARQILKNNNIPIYDPKMGKNAFGFNINEIAGVTGSAKSKAAEFSQFIDVMDGNLNTKALAAFQSKLSTARQIIENDPTKLSLESKKINQMAINLEKKYGVKLPRLRDPDATKYFSPKRLRELNAQGLDIVKAAERAGYTIEMPKKAMTIKEFVSPENKKTIETLLASFSANPKCRANFNKGGRIGYATGPASLSECAISGKNRLEKVIKGGVRLGDQEGILARQILRAGRSLGSAFTLSGLFGPAAIAFTAAVEAGIVGYDMLSSGKTFKETIGDSLLNYALGDKTKIDPEKELIKRFGTLPGMTDDKLLNIQNVLKQTNALNSILKQDLKVADLADQVKFQNQQPKDTFMSPDDEMLQTDTAMRTRQSLEGEQQKLNEILTNYRSKPPVGLSMEDSIIKDMASEKFFEDKQALADAVRDAEIQKLESRGPVFMGKVFPKFETGRQEDLLNLKANVNPASAYAIDSYENPDLNSFVPMRPFGLAGGGLAKLAGISEGPQTVSMNPDSQGLQSLKNRVKNI